MSRVIVIAMLCAGLSLAREAEAQPLGRFSWQLQPHCNRVTLNVVRDGDLYTLDGWDDQCGTGQRAPVVGVATSNPDGTIGFGFHVVTVPGGRTVHVDARLPAGALSGTWSDSAGNVGGFVFGAAAGGPPRPSPPTLAAGSVTSVLISDGTITAADVDTASLQRRLTGACPTGQYMTTAGVDGAVSCTSGPGDENTVLGALALSAVSSGGANVAVGHSALNRVSTGGGNVAVGLDALLLAETAMNNVAVGTGALRFNVAGEGNVALGPASLFNTTGSRNVAVGLSAGIAVTTGNDNVLIGHRGTTADTALIRIGTPGTQTATFVAGVSGVTIPNGVPVVVGANGQLGVTTSSRRFKDDVQELGDVGDRLAMLRPVTFRYLQPAADGTRPREIGLVAEEVAEVWPELAVRDGDGEVQTVAYHKLPVLLLREIQRLQRERATADAQLESFKARIEALERVIASGPHRVDAREREE